MPLVVMHLFEKTVIFVVPLVQLVTRLECRPGVRLVVLLLEPSLSVCTVLLQKRGFGTIQIWQTGGMLLV